MWRNIFAKKKETLSKSGDCQKNKILRQKIPFLFLFFAFWRNFAPQKKKKKKNSVPNIGIVPSPTESFGHLKKLRKGVCPPKARSRGYRKGVCLSTKSSISRLLGRGFGCQKLNLAVIRKGVCPGGILCACSV